MKQAKFLIVKTVDGTEHHGWVRGSEATDDGMVYELQTLEGIRRLAVADDKVIYTEVLWEGHERITTRKPEELK